MKKLHLTILFFLFAITVFGSSKRPLPKYFSQCAGYCQAELIIGGAGPNDEAMIKAWFFASIQVVLHNIDPAIPDGGIFISDANWDMEVIYVGGSMDLSPYWESILAEAKTQALALSGNPTTPDRILYSITTSGGDCSH